MGKRTYHFDTLQLHAGQENPDSATGARAVPVYQTTSYVFENCDQAEARFNLTEEGNIYGRLTNPTQEVLEQRMAALEGGSKALAVASGAAAISYAIMALAQAGDHIVAAKTLYGGTYNLLAHTLPMYGITADFAEPCDPENFRKAIRPETRLIFVETLGNPNSNPIHMEEIASIAHEHGIPLIVDNTFATPYLFRPLEHGADIVVHSATKFIGGHGVALGGVIVEGTSFDWGKSGKFPGLTKPNPSYHGVCFAQAVPDAPFLAKVQTILLRDTGACISPMNAFLLLQGLETLSLRVEKHIENTRQILEFLKGHPMVDRISHPSLPENPYHKLYEKYFPHGGGSIFTFDVKGDERQTKQFIDHLKLFSLLANVADSKSLVIHPASTTHAQLTPEEQQEQGIRKNTVRISVGTEYAQDLIEDLREAFSAIALS